MENGDTRSASITKCIAEEVGHVAVGMAWFVDVCRRLGLDLADHFQGSTDWWISLALSSILKIVYMHKISDRL
jgi:uncharacterized ferritin-like protein (DUF455 family)